MQFKQQGNRIQVLAYRGYDKEKRRAIIKMIGSICGYSFIPSDGLIDNMTDDEKIELQSYIEKERQSRDEITRQRTVELIANKINFVADAITKVDCKLSENWAADVFSAIDALKKSMRKRGLKRQTKANSD